MQLRRGNQKKTKKNKNIVDYEIKTYGSNSGANASPVLTNKQINKNNKRLSGRIKNKEEEPKDEMTYTNQNNQNYTIRSPIRQINSKKSNQKQENEKFITYLT